MGFVGYGLEGERIVQVYGDIEVFDPLREFTCVQHPGAAHNEKHAEAGCRMAHRLTPHDGMTELELTVDRWSEGNPAYQHTATVGVPILSGWPLPLNSSYSTATACSSTANESLCASRSKWAPSWGGH
ncbi:hypothetical protein GCM10018966_084810 [Streptomyces yanii]